MNEMYAWDDLDTLMDFGAASAKGTGSLHVPEIIVDAFRLYESS